MARRDGKAQDALLLRHCQAAEYRVVCSSDSASCMRRALRPLGVYHELPLCVVPAPAPGQATQGADGGSNGGGWAVNTDMGFVSAPVTASAAEVHEYVEVRPHHRLGLPFQSTMPAQRAMLCGHPVHTQKKPLQHTVASVNLGCVHGWQVVVCSHWSSSQPFH